MPFTKVNDIKLHYEVRGSGPRLLFIHGIGSDMKHPVGIFNSPIPHHFTVLAFDPRGLGESDSPEAPCTIADMADDAAGLARSIGWDKYHVLGTSMGGMVAQELALRHPEAVDKLVLAATNAGGENAGVVEWSAVDGLSAAERIRVSDTRMDETWAAANPEQLAAADQGYKAFIAGLRSTPESSRGYDYQVNAASNHNTYDRLGQITAPTLVYGGRYDGSCTPEVTKAMAERIPNARYELLEHGHGSWYFDPTVWQMIIDFLNS